jgi:hypothetical protein
MNWDSVNIPTTSEKFESNVKLIFSGPLKEKSEEERKSYLDETKDEMIRDRTFSG